MQGAVRGVRLQQSPAALREQPLWRKHVLRQWQRLQLQCDVYLVITQKTALGGCCVHLPLLPFLLLLLLLPLPVPLLLPVVLMPCSCAQIKSISEGLNDGKGLTRNILVDGWPCN
jgi:hypothetical protein